MEPEKRRKRRWKKPVVLFAAVLLLLLIAAAWYVNSSGFHQRVRDAIIADLEQMTGGRVEVRSIQWKLWSLEVELRDVTIHGLEPAGEPPYAHADRIYAQLKVLEWTTANLGIRYVEVDNPVVHLMTFADGTTNQPSPRLSASGAPIQGLFALEVDRAEVRNGELVVNNRASDFDVSANDLKFAMAYATGAERYDATLSADRIETRFHDYRPFASSLEVEASLWPAKAELKTLKWVSGHSDLTVSGTLADYNHPHIELTYAGHAEAALVAKIAHMEPVRGGAIELSGNASYTPETFASAGRLAVRNFSWNDGTVRVNGAEASSRFSIAPQEILLPDIQAHFLGGSANGSVEVHHWEEIAQQTGSVDLKIGGLSAAQMAAAISTPAVPLDKLNAEGTADGTVRIAWRGSPSNAVAELNLEVVPPEEPGPGTLPVRAELRATYREPSRTLEIAQFSFDSRTTRMAASGTVGSVNARLRLSVASDDFGELRPALVAFWPTRRMPLELHGQGHFEGTLAGRLDGPSIAGHLELANLDALFPAIPLAEIRTAGLPRTAPLESRPRRLHLDSLAADVQYSPSLVVVENAVLRSGTALVRFDGRAALQKGQFTADSPYQLRIQLQNGSLADLQLLAGWAYPVDGTANFSAHLSGTGDNPQGSGHFQLTNGTAYGQPFKLFAADLNFTGQEAHFDNIELRQDGGSVEGLAVYSLAAKSFRFEVVGKGFDLEDFNRIQSHGLQIHGTLDFRAKGSGTFDEPVIDAHLAIRNVILNSERAGDFLVDATTRGAELQLTGSSSLQTERIAIRGNVRLRGEYPADISLDFADLDIDPLIEASLPAQLTGHSSLTGKLHLTGPLRSPRGLSVAGDIEQFRVYLENVEVENQGPIRFSYANQVAHLEQLHLVGEDTDLKADGTVSLAGDRPIDLHADGRMNMKLLETMNPSLVASGRTVMAVSIAGTMSQPSVQGQIYIRDAGISYVDLPNGLSNINGTLVFNENRLVVQTLTAHTGGGDLALGGFIAYQKGVYFNLTASGKDIRIRYPQGVSAQADAQLRFTGTESNSLLSGDVTVNRFSITPQFDLALYLTRSTQAPAVPSTNRFINNLKLDIHIVTAPELQVQTAVAKITGDAELRIRGTAARPAVLGRVDIAEGDVNFNGTKYHLERGDILFTNPTTIEPIFNIEATTRVRDYDVTLGFHGSTDRLTTTYRSDPPLPEGDIIALLAMGRTREESAMVGTTQAQNAFTESASNAILGEALNTVVSSRAQKLFGVSQIKIDPAIGGAENNPNARITVEQQVSGRVTLTYITNLAQSTQQVIQAEFQINRNLSIIAVRDQYGVVGFDVRYRHRKK